MAALKVSIDGIPDGAVIRTVLFSEPRTTEQFYELVTAAGGPEKFRVGWESRYIVAELGDGIDFHLHPPADHKPPTRPPGSPFIREYAETIEAAKGGEES